MVRLSLLVAVIVAGAIGFVTLHRVTHEVPHTTATPITHMQAHQLGAKLYKTKGAAGISECDTNAQYGCFHGFIGAAITEHGLAVVNDIDAACQQVVGPVGCQHGIGHGLVEHEGYTLKGLASALVSCRSLINPPPFEGCYAGAFMEFDTQIMLPEGPAPRAVADNDYTYPCNKLDTEFRTACAYSQPHWWGYVLRLQATTRDFARLGALCRDLTLTGDAKLDCFGGVGVRAGDDQLVFKQAEPASTLCDSAGANDRERLVCRSMAAAFTYVNSGKNKAQAVCDGLLHDALVYCKGYATGQTKFTSPEPLPASLGGGFGS